MPYRYVIAKSDYSDYASGRVFAGRPGHPAFPIRLASEIFQACLHYRVQEGFTKPNVLYDPVCGGAYHLSVLAYLHWEAIDSIIGSDVDQDVLTTAKQNLSLLTLHGMDKRLEEIKSLYEKYGKQSHIDALSSAQKLRDHLRQKITLHTIHTRVFCADAMNTPALADNLETIKVDIVIADIPYGIRSSWHITDPDVSDPVSAMMNSLQPILSEGAIVAIAADKGTKISHPCYQRIDRFQVGKRRMTLLKPIITM